MKKLLLSLALLLGSTALASAQCVAAGNPNVSPLPGMNCPSEPSVDTYVAAGFGIAPAASATDIACITGSATKVVRLQAIRVSGTAGTLITVPVVITKHTVANTGGTAAATTALPVPTRIDSGDAAPTATTTAYTANPTIDSSVTTIDVAHLTLTTTGTTVAMGNLLFDWSSRPYSEPPTLRGVAQQVCVNINGTSPSSGLMAVSFRWTEAAQ